jgi:hypothetical protein
MGNQYAKPPAGPTPEVFTISNNRGYVKIQAI